MAGFGFDLPGAKQVFYGICLLLVIVALPEGMWPRLARRLGVEADRQTHDRAVAVEAVSKRFRGLVAVDGVSFEVPEGALFAVIGPNGAGKTTLFNMIAGAIAPDDGTISFAGEDIAGLAPDAVCRRGIARTFQLVRPFPALSVEDNVIVGALLRRTDVDAARVKARELLRRFDLFDRRHQPASSLTLPDRKRLEVMRALATEPKLLLLDEVVAGLRPTEVDRLVTVLRELNRDSGLTILLIEHVMRAVMALASRVVVLDHGTAIAEGEPHEVVRDPAVVQSYLGPRHSGRVMLRVEDLDVFYGDAQALDGVSLDIEQGAIVAIVGANGAGKTSLIRAIAGMLRPARGRIMFGETNITGWPTHRVCNLGIGQVAEGRQIFPTLTVAENLDMGAICRARAHDARTIAGACWRCSRSWPNARSRRPARCPAASSRCWRSGAA